MTAKRQAGFTFVEMGIVLVIIGIILASVMKAADIYHSAQIDRANKVFFEAWKTVVYEYYDRRGQYLGDGTDNGGSINPADGRFDGFMAPAQTGLDPNVIEAAQDAGINICGLVQSNTPVGAYTSATCADYDIFQRDVSGGFRSSSRVQVGFWTCETEGGVIRNCLRFTDVPTDVAKRLDTYYDGQAHGEQGSIRLSSVSPNPVVLSDYEDIGMADPLARSRLYNLFMILEF